VQQSPPESVDNNTLGWGEVHFTTPTRRKATEPPESLNHMTIE
jgi:hypothetical protein